MNDHIPIDPARSALFTDFYELTMAQAYFAEGLTGVAVFEAFVRRMPEQRNYLVSAGLDDVLAYLEGWRFTDDDLASLDALGGFSTDFLHELAGLRFEGDVYAVPEGTVLFAGEPIVQIVAPLGVAQLVETMVVNQIHLQTLAASKAARIVFAASGRQVVDFGSRRAHGTDAGLKVAKAAYLAGAVGTSNVLAVRRYSIPASGTMAHSYVQVHASELEAFEAFARLYPDTVLLVDTYDTLAGVRKVAELGRRLGERFQVRAIRLDSGDIAALSRQARAILDEAGLQKVRIFASGDLDEHRITEILADRAPVDAFGVGTRLVISPDAPSLEMVYKLVEYEGRPRVKLSTNKVVYPSRKQVFREYQDGRMVRDTVGRHDETLPGQPLIEQVMYDGTRLAAGRVSLTQARARAIEELRCLPEELKLLHPARSPHPVQFSQTLDVEIETLRRERMRGHAQGKPY